MPAAQEILRGDDIRENVMEWMWDVIEAAVDAHAEGEYAEQWDWDGMWVALSSIYPIRDPAVRVEGANTPPRGAGRGDLQRRRGVLQGPRARSGRRDEELTRDLERWITLQVTDIRWREHLDNMDYMRQGIGLRGYAQKDPLVEYRTEGQLMFDEMSFLIKQEVVRTLMHAEVEVDRRERRRPGRPGPVGAARRAAVPARRRPGLEALAAGAASR